MLTACLFGMLVPLSVHALANIVEHPTGCEEGISFSASKTDSLADTIPWDVVSAFTPVPEQLKALSPICAFVRTQESAVNFSYTHEQTLYRPRVYQWNAEAWEWQSIETTMNRTTNTVSATLNGTRGVIGVFADTSDMYEGTASWYRHTRYPAGAATNIYPVGTKLRVTNTANKKSTSVTVTSTWTNNNKKRIIDLVSTAFEKIGNLRAGLIPVRIERI